MKTQHRQFLSFGWPQFCSESCSTAPCACGENSLIAPIAGGNLQAASGWVAAGTGRGNAPCQFQQALESSGSHETDTAKLAAVQAHTMNNLGWVARKHKGTKQHLQASWTSLPWSSSPAKASATGSHGPCIPQSQKQCEFWCITLRFADFQANWPESKPQCCTIQIAVTCAIKRTDAAEWLRGFVMGYVSFQP